MSKGPNYGVQQTGGTMSVGQLAVGPNARNVTVVTPAVAERLRARGMGDVEARLRVLEDALNAHGHRLADAPTLHEAAKQVASEVAASRPDKSTINRLLAQIADGTKSISLIAKAVAGVKTALALLL
jgi:hypothetical protein